MKISSFSHPKPCGTLLEFLVFFIKTFGQKIFILDRRKITLSIIGQAILNLSIVIKLCIFLLGLGWHFLLVISISIFYYSIQ
jgi:hypothetical protein